MLNNASKRDYKKIVCGSLLFAVVFTLSHLVGSIVEKTEIISQEYPIELVLEDQKTDEKTIEFFGLDILEVQGAMVPFYTRFFVAITSHIELVNSTISSRNILYGTQHICLFYRTKTCSDRSDTEASFS